MRKVTLLIAVLIGFAMNAQIYYQLPVAPGNPGGLNADDEYPVGGGLSATWTTILSGGNTTPVWSPNQTIPFTFKFNNATESSFKVSSSGVLTFTTSATSVPGTTPAQLPSTSIPDKSVMVWGITGSGTNDAITTKVFGTAPNRQLWVFFASYSIPGSANAWSYWSIVLEETTNNIYMVDQRNANGSLSATVGVQVNGSTAYAVSGSPNVGHLCQNDPTAADNFYYAFLPGPQPTYDASGVAINTPADFEGLNSAPYTIDAEFLNLGTQTITSADINYSINGGATVTQAVTGLNIASFQSDNISHPTTWNPSVGTYNVEVWLSNINGNADEKPNNDKVSKTVTIVAALTTRYPLYETFTSSTCPPCTPANETMEEIFGDNPGESVSLKYQMSWPGAGDPYYTDEGGTRRQYYSVNSVPNVAIDGGWNNNGNSLTQAIFDQYQAVPAFVVLNLTYTISGQTVCAMATIEPLTNLPAGMKLHMAIKEWKTDDNIKSNGETEFFSVMKKMVPDAGGTTLPAISSGSSHTVQECYTFNGSKILPPNAGSPVDHSIAHTVEEFSDLTVVAWVQDDGDKQVLQATEGHLVIGIDDFDPATHNLKLFPNPAKDIAFVSVDMTESAAASVNVVNALGQVVISKSTQVESGTNMIELNTADLASGVYFVQIEIEGATQTMKLTVQ